MNRLLTRAPLTTDGLSRRGLIAAGAATLGGLLLSGCDRLANAPAYL